MIKLLLVSSLGFCAVNAKSQAVKLLTLEELDGRIHNGKDTVYIVNF